jgi:hypothetical protein
MMEDFEIEATSEPPVSTPNLIRSNKFIATCQYGRYTNNLWQFRKLFRAIPHLNRTLVFPKLGEMSSEFIIDLEKAAPVFQNALINNQEFYQKVTSLASSRPLKVAVFDQANLKCWKSFLTNDNLNLEVSIFNNSERAKLRDIQSPDHDVVLLGGLAAFVFDYADGNAEGQYQDIHYMENITKSARDLINLVNSTGGLMIGVHLRLEDLSAKVPPLNVSFPQIKALKLKQNASSLLICSNGNEDEIRRVQEELSSLVRVLQIGCPVDKIPMCSNPTLSIAIEQTALSLTDVFLGTDKSSFSLEIWRRRRFETFNSTIHHSWYLEPSFPSGK